MQTWIEVCRVEDSAGRRALWERLRAAIADLPDPWHAMQEAAVDARQFIPLVPA